jgi:hypothetical protein
MECQLSGIGLRLPPPSNWQDFERLYVDVFSRIWKTNDAEMHGRTGQPQAGIDVYGTDRVEGRFVGGPKLRQRDDPRHLRLLVQGDPIGWHGERPQGIRENDSRRTGPRGARP